MLVIVGKQNLNVYMKHTQHVTTPGRHIVGEEVGGDETGEAEGPFVVGSWVGLLLGCKVGELVEGEIVGLELGVLVGDLDGEFVGSKVGPVEGLFDGEREGLLVG